MKKPNIGIQFPFNDELFVYAVKVKKTKREKKDSKWN